MEFIKKNTLSDWKVFRSNEKQELLFKNRSFIDIFKKYKPNNRITKRNFWLYKVLCRQILQNAFK